MSMDCIIASLHSVECLLCKERNINVCVLCQIVQDRTHVFLNKDRGGLAIHLQEGSSKRGKRGWSKSYTYDEFWGLWSGGKLADCLGNIHPDVGHPVVLEGRQHWEELSHHDVLGD